MASPPIPRWSPGPCTLQRFRELGATYLDRLQAKAPSAARIVDKLPQNFELIGLIHLALPDARILHITRDPVDTCLSCFSTRGPVAGRFGGQIDATTRDGRRGGWVRPVRAGTFRRHD